PSEECLRAVCSSPNSSSTRTPVCLRGFETEFRSRAKSFVRESAMSRPEWLCDPAPSLQWPTSEPPRGNVRFRIFLRRRPGWQDDRAQTFHKRRASVLFQPAPPLLFRERCDLPAREIQLCAKI